MSTLTYPSSSISVLLFDKPAIYTELDICVAIIQRALEVSKREDIRWYPPAINRYISSITNMMHLGRLNYMKLQNFMSLQNQQEPIWTEEEIEHVPNPFPHACMLKDEVLDILITYCMEQPGINGQPWDDWNDGWNLRVVPELETLLASLLSSYNVTLTQVNKITTQ